MKLDLLPLKVWKWESLKGLDDDVKELFDIYFISTFIRFKPRSVSIFRSWSQSLTGWFSWPETRGVKIAGVSEIVTDHS